eukprot:3818181-Pyramimonas_sp.AAC.1
MTPRNSLAQNIVASSTTFRGSLIWNLVGVWLENFGNEGATRGSACSRLRFQEASGPSSTFEAALQSGSHLQGVWDRDLNGPASAMGL